MPSGPCGGTAPGNLQPLGFQLSLHWFRPVHSCRLAFAAHICRTPETWDLTFPRRRLYCLWTPARRLLSGDLLRDAPVQAAPYSVAYKDAFTQLSFSEFFQRSFLSKALPCRSNPLLPPGASTSSNISPTPVPQEQSDVPPPPPLGLEDQNLSRFCTHNTIQKQRPRARLRRMVSVLSCQVHRIHLSFLPPSSPMSVPPKWDNIPLSPLQPRKVRQYRPCGNPVRHQCRGPCWSPYSCTHGTLRAIQTTWTWLLQQRRQ